MIQVWRHCSPRFMVIRTGNIHPSKREPINPIFKDSIQKILLTLTVGPELAALYQQLRTDPSSDGGGEWINLDPYQPNQLPRLTQSNVLGDLTTIAFVNFTQADVLLYEVTSAGTELYWSRCAPGGTRGRPTRVNRIWLIKDLDGRNIAVCSS